MKGVAIVMIKYPIRVAVIMGKYTPGGIKSVIMNYYREIDKSKIQFDFFVYDNSPDKDYSEIESMGGKIVFMSSLKNPIKNVIDCYKAFKKNNYPIVHGYLNTLNVFPMFAAWLANVPVRIAENLSTAHPGEKKSIIKSLLKPFNLIFPTHYAANAIYAGKWLYGDREFAVFRNGLDLSKYKHDEARRKAIRAQYGIIDNFVIGHIGRYEYQKNHSFLIDVFKAIHDRDNKARLLLVGYGSLKDEIWNKISNLGLQNAVVDAGKTEDIIPLYDAMDCFVLPSFYEGLPVVGIEAQAMGLPCIFSDEVTSEVKIIHEVLFLSLSNDVNIWADTILSMQNSKRAKENTEDFITSGYNIKEESLRLSRYYLSCLNDLRSEYTL